MLDLPLNMVGTESGSSNNLATFSVSSTGTITWARKFVLGTSAGARNIAVDSSGNIYVVCVFSASGAPVYSAILKYNSSGTLQWQRTLKGPGNSNSYGLYAQDITTANGNVIITGYQNTTGVSNAWYGFTFSVPTDGSLTGTIVNGGNSYVYAAGTGTESAGQTVTITTVSNSTTTLSASNATTTLTNSIVFKCRQSVKLVFAYKYHCWSNKFTTTLSCQSIRQYVYPHRTRADQCCMVIGMQMPLLNIPSFFKVHKARKHIAYSHDFDFWLIHVNSLQ